MSDEHQTQTYAEGNNYKSKCLCGWVSALGGVYTVTFDGEQHERDANARGESSDAKGGE